MIRFLARVKGFCGPPPIGFGSEYSPSRTRYAVGSSVTYKCRPLCRPVNGLTYYKKTCRGSYDGSSAWFPPGNPRCLCGKKTYSCFSDGGKNSLLLLIYV